MTAWLESIYTFLSRLWDYLTFAFDYIQTGLTYIFTAPGAVLSFSSSFPSEIAVALFVSVGVCILLFILGR